MNEAHLGRMIGEHRRRIAELEADRDRWEESSANWQTLYQQECDRREQAEAKAHCTTCGNLHPVIHHVCCANAREDRADLERENERLDSLLDRIAALCDERARAWGEDTRSPAVPRWIREVRDVLAGR